MKGEIIQESQEGGPGQYENSDVRGYVGEVNTDGKIELLQVPGEDISVECLELAGSIG